MTMTMTMTKICRDNLYCRKYSTFCEIKKNASKQYLVTSFYKIAVFKPFSALCNKYIVKNNISIKNDEISL